jgi:hypothetical protein
MNRTLSHLLKTDMVEFPICDRRVIIASSRFFYNICLASLRRSTKALGFLQVINKVTIYFVMFLIMAIRRLMSLITWNDKQNIFEVLGKIYTFCFSTLPTKQLIDVC